MFCSYCGRFIPDNTVVCPICGCPTRNARMIPSEPEQPKSNGMAIAGFICSFFIPILGWIFGGIGLSKASKRKGKGKGLSIAALVIASISFLVNLGLML